MGGRGGKGRTRVDANAPSWWPNAHQPALDEPDEPGEPSEEPTSSRPSAEDAALPAEEQTEEQADHGAGVESRIRATIRDLAAEPNAWVSLTRLRAALADLPREKVDAALKQLNSDPNVHLAPEENQKTLTDQDWAAGVSLGNQTKHLISVWEDQPSRPSERAQDPSKHIPDLQPPTGPAGDDQQATGLESHVRSAYDELATKKQDWVRLSKLRDKLGNPDPAEMNRILRNMTRTGRVHLAPDSNRKALTDADRAAAIRIGSEDKHLIAIEPPDDDPFWR